MFERTMDALGYTSNSSLPKNVAVISIDNTENCEHYFETSSNVLNLDFDDIDPLDWNESFDSSIALPNDYIYKGKLIAFTPDLAKMSIDFIEKHIHCDFYLHCSAGISRSQAFVCYIQDVYPQHKWEINKCNPPQLPNYHVLHMLKEAKFKNSIYGKQ